MKLRIMCYKTNADIFVEENGENILSFSINFDDIFFDNAEALEDYVKDEIRFYDLKLKAIENLEEILNKVYVNYNYRIMEGK